MGTNGRPGIGRRVWSLVWTVFLVLGLSAAVTAFPPAPMTPVAVAGTGTSPDSKLRVTKTASVTALPAGGGPVTYTYTVQNTTAARTLYYSSMTDDRCANVGHVSGMSRDARGDFFLPPGGTATFRCTMTVTTPVTNTVTAQFTDPGDGRTSIAQATESVNVAAGAITCDQIWYSSFTASTGPTSLGTVSASGATSRVDPRVTYNGREYRSVTSLAINPLDPQWVYYVPRIGNDPTTNAGTWRYNVTTNEKQQVTTPHASATNTNRLAFSSDGTLWSWASNGRLYSLSSGVTTWTDRGAVVSNAGANLAALSSGDMVFDGLGNMWLIASNGTTNTLYTISAAGLVGSGTNTANLVGSMGTGVTFNGLAFAPNGTLYASASNVGGAANSLLYTVNTSTGGATPVSAPIPSSTFGQLGDLASCALPKPELQVTKTSDVQATQAGGLITYTIEMKNIGTAAATEVTFQDFIPTHTTYVSSTLNGRPVGTSGVNYWATPQPVTGSTATVPGVVPAGDTATITVTVRVDNPLAADVTQIVNSGVYDYVGIDPTPTDDPTQPGGQDQTITPINRSEIAVDKEADPGTLTETGQVVYTYRVVNLGTDPIRDVAVADDRCSPLTRVGGDANNNGLLDLKETWTYECRQTLTHSHTATGPETVTNTATVTGTGTSTSSPVMARDTADVVITPGTPGLELVKTVADASQNGIAEVGEKLTYTFTVTNTGQVPLAPVTIDDPTLGLESEPCVESLAPGATATCPEYAYTVRQADVDAGSVANTASVSGTPPAGGVLTSESSATLPTASTTGLVLDKVADRTTGLVLGDEVRYSFLVTNAGAVTLAPVRIADAALGIVDAACVDSLAPGETATCTATGTHTITQADMDAGQFVNTATATGTPPGGNAAVTGEDSVTVTTAGVPAINVVKTADTSAGTEVGDVVTYTFTVHNEGTVTLAPVTITDPLLNMTDELCVNSLAPGETATCTATGTHTITQADVDAGQFANTVTASGTPPSGPAVTDQGVVVVSPDGTAGLRVNKLATPAVGLMVGDEVSYTFTVTNTGVVTLEQVRIADAALGIEDAACVDSLAPGETATCTATGTHTITQADMDAGQFVNTATATATLPRGGTLADTDTEIVTTAVAPALEVAKTATPSSDVAAGDRVTYRFTVTNTGNVTLAPVTITDPQLGLDAEPCADSLAPGASVECDTAAEYTVSQADVDAGGVTNTVVASGTPQSGGAVTAQGQAVVTTDGEAGLTLDKIADPSTGVEVGEAVTYTFTVTNTGDVTLAPVTITDARLGITGQPCVASLAPKATATCTTTGTHTITQADVDAGQYVNTATATGTPPAGGAPVTGEDTETVTLTGEAALLLTKTADLPEGRYAGGVVNYTFTVENTGTVTLAPVTVSDPTLGIPDSPCVDSLAPGDRATCSTTGRYTLTQADVLASRFDNTATATGTPPAGQPVTATDTETVTMVQTPGLAVAKVASPTSGLRVGDVVTFTFTVTNTGESRLAPVTISDDELGIEPTTCAESLAVGQSVTCAVRGTHVITQDDVNRGSYDNTATASGTDPSGAEINSSDTETVTTESSRELELSKSVDDTGTGMDGEPVEGVSDDGVAQLGERIVYTFTVTNTGTTDLRNVFVDDPRLGLPNHLCVETLAPGATATCAVSYEVTAADIAAGAILNEATATAHNPADPEHPVDSLPDEATIPTQPARDGLVLEKTVADASGDGIAQVGEVVTYTFTVRNTGETTVTGIVVIDDRLPGGRLECVATLAPGATDRCTATYRVTATDVAAGPTIINTATAQGTTRDGATVESAPDDATISTGTAGLTLDKSVTDASGDGIAQAGELLNYTFTVTNTGPVTVTGLRIVETEFNGTGDRSSLDAPSCQATTLAPNASTTCTATYRVTQADLDAAEPLLANTAVARATDPTGVEFPSNADSATIPPATQNPGLVVDKRVTDASGDGIAQLDETLTYTFTVRNTGDVTLTRVGVTEESFSGTGDLPTPVCEPTTLAPGEVARCTATYTVVQDDLDAQEPLVNVAHATGTTPAGDPVVSPPDSATIPPASPASSLTMVKKVRDASGDGRADVGEVLTYTFTVINTGDVPLRNVEVVDPRVSATPIPCVAELPARGTATCVVEYTVTQADHDSGAVHNIATAEGTPPSGVTTTSPPDEATIPSSCDCGPPGPGPGPGDGSSGGSSGGSLDWLAGIIGLITGSAGSAGSTGSAGSDVPEASGSLGGMVGSLALASLGLGSTPGSAGSEASGSGVPGSEATGSVPPVATPEQGAPGGGAVSPAPAPSPVTQGPPSRPQPGPLTTVTTGGSSTAGGGGKGSALANTGVTVAALAGATALLVVVGVGLVLVSRKRRTEE